MRSGHAIIGILPLAFALCCPIRVSAVSAGLHVGYYLRTQSHALSSLLDKDALLIYLTEWESLRQDPALCGVLSKPCSNVETAVGFEATQRLTRY